VSRLKRQGSERPQSEAFLASRRGVPSTVREAGEAPYRFYGKWLAEVASSEPSVVAFASRRVPNALSVSAGWGYPVHMLPFIRSGHPGSGNRLINSIIAAYG
jgi:hypothetical protein